MRNPLITFFLRRYVFATAIFVGMVLVGLLLGSRLGVELLPRFSFPVVAVSVAYPGAGPEEVAEKVAKPLEDALSTLTGVDTIGSTSTEGFVLVFIQFRQEVNVDQALVEVSQKVAAARGALPKDASPPVVQKFDPSQTPILSLFLEAPGEDLARLGRYAQEVVKPRLQLVPGVAEIRISGAPEEVVRVDLDPGRLTLYGLSPAQVVQAIAASSLNLPLGSLEEGGRRLTYTLRNTPKGPEEVAETPVGPVRVGELGRVYWDKESPKGLARLNGRPGVLLSILKTPESNAVSVAQGVKDALPTLPLPKGYRLEVASDTTRFIRGAVQDTFREMILAALAVSLVVLVFVGRLNSVFSVILAIPITLASSLILFGVLGFTFNLISLLALTVAVGIVVDDSIVVAENIDRLRKEGRPPFEAVLEGASQVSVAVAAATLSLLAVFLPISFLPGIVGQIFREFGLVLAAAIAVSWLEAFLFLTVRLAYFPDPEPPRLEEALRAVGLLPSDLRQAYTQGYRSPLGLLLALGVVLLGFRQPLYLLLLPLYPPFLGLFRYLARLALGLLGSLAGALFHGAEGGVKALTQGYVHLLSKALDRPRLVLGVAALAFFSLFPILPRIPFNFTPRSDTGLLTATLLLPKDTPLGESDRLSRRLEGYFLSQQAVDRVVTTLGSRSIGGTEVLDPSRAQFILVLKPKGEREEILALAERFGRAGQALVAGFPGAELRIQAQTGPQNEDADLQLILEAPNQALLERKTAEAVKIIAEEPYIKEVRSTLEEQAKERVFAPDPTRLQGTGLTPSEIAQTLRTYLSGTEAGVVRKGGEEYPIRVRLDPLALDELGRLRVQSPSLGSLPLENLGRLEERPAPTSVARRNQAYSAGLNINLTPDAPGTLQVQRRLEALLKEKGVLEDGVVLSAAGTASLTGDLVALAPQAFGLALVLNYLVIASQFNSWTYPLYLLLPVPLALVGAFWLTYLLGTGLDVISVLGVVMLIGLVTKNAILLLDFAVKKWAELPLKEALLEAARLRLRPILMTTLTVLIISLPLLLGLGEGAEYRRPLGVIILGGLLSSTLLTLFVVPTAFYLVERRRKAGGKPTPVYIE